MKPVKQREVEAANRLHDRVVEWRNGAEALSKLRNCLGNDWDFPSTLLKCVAVNALYNTNVIAIRPMAKHVSAIMKKYRGGDYPADLVERIAALKLDASERIFNSFASKLCNLFVDAEAFPIFDKVACETLQDHLQKKYEDGPSRPYTTFRRNLVRLREISGIRANNQQLDHYLWVKGLCVRHKNGKRINSELARVLEQPTPQDRADLKELLPKPVRR